MSEEKSSEISPNEMLTKALNALIAEAITTDQAFIERVFGSMFESIKRDLNSLSIDVASVKQDISVVKHEIENLKKMLRNNAPLVFD